MSWESTLTYYRLINEGVRDALGGLHSARILLNSLDFAPIETLQRAEDWPAMARLLVAAGQTLESAGAECLLICTNTMHRVAPEVEAALSIPLLHIADATGAELQTRGIQTVGLLGTRFTMEQPFYRQRLQERFGIEVHIPPEADRLLVHRVIYEELCNGQMLADSQREFLRIIADLGQAGAQTVILGCTEIGLLVRPGDTTVPILDTTQVHAACAVAFALEV